MLREKERLLKNILRIIDLLLAFPAFYGAYYGYTHVLSPNIPFLPKELYPIGFYLWILYGTLPLGFVLFQFNDLYSTFRIEPKQKILIRILRAVAIMTLLEYLGIFILLKMYHISRFLVLLFMTIYLLLLIGYRSLLLILMHRTRTDGFGSQRVLVIGTGRIAREVYEEILAHQFWGLKLLGFIATGNPNLSVPKEKVIGVLGDLERILKREVIDAVFVALSEKEAGDREEIFRTCEKIGVSTYLVPAYYEWQLAKSTTSSLGKLNLISFFTVPMNPYLLGLKRSIDVVVSSLFLIFFPFLYGVIGLLIKLDSPGPILYRQIRVAHNKRQFHCYKFRTMIKDADKRLDLLEAIDETEGPIRKSREDPRITRVGKILRRFSIDEIPQFINVFKGEMTLVGPRPPTPDEVETYEFHQLRRLSVKQGLTGLWQVSGRDAIKNFEERLKLDLYYIDNWSLWMDTKILLKTIFIIFKGAN
jgi:exopolysaccharide biosynthesis polyprenyl glycosylphosphotransferase